MLNRKFFTTIVTACALLGAPLTVQASAHMKSVVAGLGAAIVTGETCYRAAKGVPTTRQAYLLRGIVGMTLLWLSRHYHISSKNTPIRLDQKIHKQAQQNREQQKHEDQQQQAQFNQARGCMLGGALGDAMGNPTEFLDMDTMYKKFPNGIHTFADFHQTGTVPYTDDTAMSIATARAILASKDDQAKLMEHIAHEYVKDMHDPEGWAKGSRAPGNTCLRSVRLLEQHKGQIPGYGVKAGEKGFKQDKHPSNGCGAVMRAHVFGIAYKDNPALAAQLAAEHSLITHGAPSSVAACAALALGVAQALQKVPHEQIIHHMIQIAEKYDKETAAAMRDVVQQAEKNRASLQATNDPALLKAQQLNIHNAVFTKYLGWNARDAIAAATYIFVLYPDDIKMAHYLGVHTPGDSDSIASIAGALVGARVGYQAIEKAYGKEMLARLEGHDALLKLAADLQASRA